MTEIKSDKIITPDGIKSGYLYIDGEKIACFSTERLKAEECVDCTGYYVSAGFIDMHTHGGGGYPFINGTCEDVINACNFHLCHGTTSILPTVTAGSFDVMKAAVKNIAEAKNSGRVKSNIVGAHMEGPYLSVKQCGAQCPDFITPPVKSDYEGLVREYGNYISRWTYAPENDRGGEFCKFITDNGIIASAGHTDATYKDMQTAIANGCNLVTHLYSCTSTVTRNHGFRTAGVIESALSEDALCAEIIADGRHLPPELIKTVVKIKGEDNVVLCTDSLAIAGTDIESGVMSGTKFIVEDGVCKLEDRSAFAGSVATADRLIAVLVKECGFTVDRAVKMLTQTPARLLGLKSGKLATGYYADVVVFDDDIRVVGVIVKGVKRYGFNG